MSDQDVDRYLDALHAIQTGVGTEHTQGSDDGTPKHLRVGIIAGQITSTAMCTLLIEKGVFTLDELQAVMATESEKVVGEYENRINAAYGVAGVVKLS